MVKNMVENKNKTYKIKIEHLDATDPKAPHELCIRFPDELMEQLGWEIGDDVEWEETEIWDEDKECKGFTLVNLTKNPRDKKG